MSYTALDGGEHKLCGNDPIFTTIQQDICSGADIMSSPIADGTDAGCNAVSLAVGFNGTPARLGPPVASRYASAGCDGSVAVCP